jgi:hypothetical protein
VCLSYSPFCDNGLVHWRLMVRCWPTQRDRLYLSGVPKLELAPSPQIATKAPFKSENKNTVLDNTYQRSKSSSENNDIMAAVRTDKLHSGELFVYRPVTRYY